MSEITFENIKAFAKFVSHHVGLGKGQTPTVFESMEHGGYRNGGENHHLWYRALVPVFEMQQFVVLTLDLREHLPQEWGTMSSAGRLFYSAHNKIKLIQFLKNIEVKTSEISKLNKTKVSSLRQVVDSTPTKMGNNETVEEITYRLQHKGDTVALTSKKYGKVSLRVGKESGARDLYYTCECDWGTKLSALKMSVAKELKKYKLPVVPGKVELGR